MNLVDSSAWLEYFANGPNAASFARPIEKLDKLLVPALCLFEVFKRVFQHRDENDALHAVAAMHQGLVVGLNGDLALRAARLSIAHKLPMADSVILATAQAFEATLWTQDAHFKDLEGVEYKKRRL